MKKHLFLLASLTLGMAACTNDTLSLDDQENSTPENGTVSTNFIQAKLATFDGNTDQVVYEPSTRAEQQPLELIATINNPSSEFFKDSDPQSTDGRYLSATSVFKHTDGTYYVTYHVQGNNYSTDLETPIGGAIQVFTVANNEEELVINPGKGFRAASPSTEDYDFNHIYFDRTSDRIVVVGHNWKAHQDGSADPNYENTTAIIGKFNPVDGTLDYKKIYTDEKILDASGKSLGNKDAGDANCVVRANDAGAGLNNVGDGWGCYFVATRKGLAVLSAIDSDLFEPARNEDGTIYFIQTPGSAKFIAPTGTSSYYGLLYLSENKSLKGDDNKYETESQAKIAKLSLNTANPDNRFGFFQTWDSPFTKFDPQTMKIEDFEQQITLPATISPIDGKNTLAILGSSEFFAALGTGGVFSGTYNFNTEVSSTLKTFGNRPVNCVAVDNNVNESGHGNKGYLYVANGARLSILKRDTMQEVASYTLSAKDEIDNTASANYIHVENTGDEETGKRIVTVAYGQAGVRIFNFTPPVK